MFKVDTSLWVLLNPSQSSAPSEFANSRKLVKTGRQSAMYLLFVFYLIGRREIFIYPEFVGAHEMRMNFNPTPYEWVWV